MAETYKVMLGERFPSALTLESELVYLNDDRVFHSHPDAKFLDEIRCLKFIQAVMEKPGWRQKMKDKEIVAKWKAESKDELRDEMFEYAIDELVYLSNIGEPEFDIEPSGVDLVWRSDKLIPEDLHTKFSEAVKRFASSITEKDYHPNSNDQVLNLVHPSLFCLVYGKSTDKEGKVVELTENFPSNRANSWRGHPDVSLMWSRRFQWLPAEFLVDNEGKVKIESYINSLPFSSGLYPILAEIFERTIPLFNRVLTDLLVHRERIRFHRPDGYYWWSECDPPDEIFEGLEEDDWEARDVKQEEWMEQREINPLPIPKFNPTIYKVEPSEIVDLKGHRLQVIVKIGSVELTPEKPTFPGGNWHVEGMGNEKIVATGIYYYDSENIQDNHLNFRQSVELDTMEFDQDDSRGAILMFGMDRDDPMVQDAGTISTPTGRVLVFPNVYQHALGKFSLKDKSKPGHRKILVFFLVDPTSRIVSTAHVPPQDISWHDALLQEKLANKLPVEITGMVRGQIGYQMTLEEAKAYRLELMMERSTAKDIVTEVFFERPFNLCEH